MLKFNSTIRQKKCKCSDDCDKFPTLGWNGYFLGHAPQELREKQTKRSITNRNRAKINDLSRKVKIYAKEKIDEISALKCVKLNDWFKEREKEVESRPYCQECGKWIPKKFYRYSVAHIFPKAIFPSVATHPLNYLILGAGCGCHEKTHRLDNFSKMKCFKEAVERFRQFENQITENHKYKDLFIEYAKSKQF